VTEARDVIAPQSGELRQPPLAVGDAAAVAGTPEPDATAAAAANASTASSTQLRISKFLMQCGLGSRRHVEEMIAAGRVSSNGVAVDAPGFKIEPDAAAITVDGKRVQPLPEGSALAGSSPSAASSTQAGAAKGSRKAAPAAAVVVESLSGNHVLSAASRSGDDAGRLVRIAKYMARCGVASRRQAEEMIAAGRVTLNGATVLEPGTKLEPGSDSVKLDGKSVVGARTRPQLFLVHKLKGEIISASGVDASGEGSAAGRGGAGAAAARGDDAQRRRTGDRRLQERLTLLDRAGLMGLPERLIPVGGLDFSSTGLQLLTTDPALARVLEHEVNAGLFKRTYEVRVYGRHLGRAIRALRNGGRIDGIGRLSPSDVELLSERQKGAKADAPTAAGGDGARGGSAARRAGAGAGVVSDAESEGEGEGEEDSERRRSVPPADAVPYKDGEGEDGREGAGHGEEDEDLPPRIALLRITMAEGNVSALPLVLHGWGLAV
jgi:23S rRNA pseudouridine2605 synthase